MSWPEVTLGEICEFKYGKSLPEKKRQIGPVSVFGSNGAVGKHTEGITNGPTVVVGRKGSVGEINFSPEACWPIDTTYYLDRTCTEQDPKWLYYALQELRLPDLNKATGVPGLNRNDAYEKKLPLPPLAEQKRIAAILDQADSLRRLRQRAIDHLKTLGQAIFYEMFGDPSRNPMVWETSCLGSICDVGSSKRVFVNELVEEGIPFYRGTEIGKLGNGESIDPSLFITREHYERLKAQSGVPHRGDLLLPSICPDGRIYLVEDDSPFYFKDGRVLWIRVDSSRINSTFLRYHLKQLFFADYSKIASGTTFSELKIFALKDLKIQVPPVKQQKRFAVIVDSIERQKTFLRAHLAELDTLFPSLQHRAFRGEL